MSWAAKPRHDAWDAALLACELSCCTKRPAECLGILACAATLDPCSLAPLCDPMETIYAITALICSAFDYS